MSPFDPASPRGRVERSPREQPRRGFYLYVEGPRDRDILRIWARKLSPGLARSIEPCVVILGGRRPARAVDHFRSLGGHAAEIRGLVVLDRDHHSASHGVVDAEPGLELFTWGRRHIESYVLVPDAICRLLDGGSDAARMARLLAGQLPNGNDEAACRDLNAKHLLSTRGPIARALGRTVSPREIARQMRAEELHSDVLSLFGQIGASLGTSHAVPEVVRRPATDPEPDGR